MPANIRAQLIMSAGMVMLIVILCWTWRNDLIDERTQILKLKFSHERVLASMRGKKEKPRGERNISSQPQFRPQLLKPTVQQKLFPVMTMDEISRSLSQLDIWLTALSIDQEQVSIQGKSFSRSDIHTFMENLEQSAIFSKLTRLHIQPLQSIETESLQHFSFEFQAQDFIL